MKYYPTLETVRQLAGSGGYRRVPICCELLADRYTPVEVLRILRGASRHCYLLESASQTEVWGRYSFLGCNPSLELTLMDHQLRIRRLGKDGTESAESRRAAHPGEAIREILKENKSPVMEGFPPFTGGLAGYFSYDYIKYSEPGLESSGTEEGKDGQQDFRDMDLMLFDEVIAFDHYRQKICLIAGVRTREPEKLEQAYEEAAQRLERLADLIRSGKRKEFPPLNLQSELKPQFSREEYEHMVERAKQYIYEGDIFQVVLSNPIRAKAEGSLFDTYRVLRAGNPSPYMFYFSSDDIEIAGASPETLVKLEGQTLSTFPLAGTRPRGRTREEDLQLEKELLQDEKELAEHNMLEPLGVKITLSPEKSEELLRKINICFLFAQNYHIAMKYVAPIRRELGIRTVFNILGPLSNPAGANMELMGVFDETLVAPLAQVMMKLGVKRGMVVYGQDKLDEISMCAPTTVCEIRDGWFQSYELTPEQFGYERCEKGELQGGMPEENAEITRRILNGTETGAKRQAVCLNAGAALYIAGKAENMEAGVRMAEKLIDSGAALEKLQQFIRESNEEQE